MKRNILKKISDAFNAYTGRFEQLDSGGFPVFSRSTVSGYSINSNSALYATPVFSCVSLLSQVIASIPFKLYLIEKDGDIFEDKKNPLYNQLLIMPNKYQTAYEYWLYNLQCILLRGGFVSWKNIISGNRLHSLVPINPDTITRELINGELYFSGNAQIGPNNYFNFNREHQSNFFWTDYMTVDGVNPCSPIKYMAESISMALSAEGHGAAVFKNDATPPIVIEYPGDKSPEQLKNMAKVWKSGGTGDNYGTPRFIDGGGKLTKIQMSNEDAQYIESRKFQKEDICGVYRVPPSMIGDTTRAQGWSTLEQKNTDFLTYTLMPYMRSIQLGAMRSLIPMNQWDSKLPEWETNALLKADIVARSNYYKNMYNLGSLNPDEIRKSEGLNKRDGGDEYVRPGNMVIDNNSNSETNKNVGVQDEN